MKTINIIGITLLAPLAAVFFIFAIGFKSVQTVTTHFLVSDHDIENESVPLHI